MGAFLHQSSALRHQPPRAAEQHLPPTAAERHHPPAAAEPLPPAPETLHPALWRAHQLGGQREPTCASGFAALDAELPGGGWPHRALTELLLPHPGIGELRLLAPALAAVQRHGRVVLLFDPPASLCAWACLALGLELQKIVLVRSRASDESDALAAARPPRPPWRKSRRPAPDLLWTLEQALASGHTGAVLAWLPAVLGSEALRRLQLAAQAHDGPAFVLRDAQARLAPSVAPLRLLLGPAPADRLTVALLKRRGPPLEQPLLLALRPTLSAAARQRSLQTQRVLLRPARRTAAA